MKINRTNVTTVRKVGKRCGKHGNNVLCGLQWSSIKCITTICINDIKIKGFVTSQMISIKLYGYENCSFRENQTAMCTRFKSIIHQVQILL